MSVSPDRLQRITSRAAVGVAVGLVVALWLAWQLRFGTEYVENWLPADAPSRQAYAEFTQRFGGDQVLLLAWRGATLGDPRIEQAVEHLKSLQRQHPHWPITSITHSQQAIDLLREKLAGLTQAAAVKRLAGQLVGGDGSAFIAIQLRGLLPRERDELIASLSPLMRSLGISQHELVIAGEPYQTHVIDHYSRLSVQRYVPFSMLLSLLVAWGCLRSWRLTLMVMALAGVGQLVGMALISSTVGQMGAILIVVPTLLFMLTLSAAVHLVNYYQDCRADGLGFPGARALQLGFKPCLLAAVTTAFGFLSLAVSQLEPVFQFGALAAGGVLVTCLLLLLNFIPATRLQEWTARSSAAAAGRAYWFPEMLIGLISRRGRGILIVGLLLLIAAAGGLPRITATTRFDGMFEPSHPSVRSLRWVETRLGPIETLEFVVGFPLDEAADVVEQLDTVRALQQTLDDHRGVHSTFSAIHLLPPLPTQSGARATIRRSVFRNLVSADLDDLAAAQWVAREPAIISWRITARFKTASDADFHQLKADLREGAERLLVQRFADTAARPSLEITGLRAVIETANALLLHDLIGSFTTAFLLITPVMMVIVRSFWGGLVLMIPNVLPVVLVFGLMGWLAVPLDVASILTASVALGIAVDDTLHFLIWYQRGKQAGGSAQQAAAEAIRRCARPILFTTLISSGAMLPFMFGEFLPPGKFALLLILILTGAVVGDLLLLPALLVSRLGKWIDRGPRPGPTA